jgi:hypothetical protein
VTAAYLPRRAHAPVHWTSVAVPWGPLQIVVAPPYETCTSLHGDDAAALRVKKVVSPGCPCRW